MCPSRSAEALRGHINVPFAYKELRSLPVDWLGSRIALPKPAIQKGYILQISVILFSNVLYSHHPASGRGSPAGWCGLRGLWGANGSPTSSCPHQGQPPGEVRGGGPSGTFLPRASHLLPPEWHLVVPGHCQQAGPVANQLPHERGHWGRVLSRPALPAGLQSRLHVSRQLHPQDPVPCAHVSLQVLPLPNSTQEYQGRRWPCPLHSDALSEVTSE